MRGKDLILIHPPSVFDFRKKPIFWGPISDTVPSTPVFEMYPLGFMTIANYLHQNHYSVEIVNLALRMMKDINFNVEKYLSSLKAKAFGIDFHWLPHVQGSLEVARLLKKLHPNVPIIMGGLSATYYAQEILEHFHQIDFIIKGDSTEEPLLYLLREIEKGKEDFSSIPNLSWRNRDGKIYHNSITYVPNDLNHLSVDKWFLASFILKGMLNDNHKPYYLWDKAPMAAILTCKGCSFNCVTCGGSCYTYSQFYGRERIAFRSPKNLIEDLSIIASFTKDMPVYIIGDLRQGGNKYVEEFLSRLRNENIDIPIIFEIFTPASKDFIDNIAKSVHTYGFTLSPESADLEVRMAQGRHYTNDEIERCIIHSLEAGASRFDLFFMLGLGKETEDSVQKTFKYCLKLTKAYHNKNFYTFLSTLTPSLDPGSQAFEYPFAHGFRLRYKTLLNHYHAYSMPSWAYFINYSTQNFSSQDIVELTYRVAYFTAELRRIHSNKDEVDLIKSRIDASKLLLKKIDEIMQLKDDLKRDEELQRLTAIIQSDIGNGILHTPFELLRALSYGYKNAQS
ncbi:MAG: TIGR04190 family B12-binding domain/radical SAM domain protein [Nitrososphaerales archaeon]